MVEARSIRRRLVVPAAFLTVLGLLGPSLAPHGGGSLSRTLAPARPGSNLQPGAAQTLIADPSVPLTPQISTSLHNDTSPALRTLRPVAPLSSATGVRPGAPVESDAPDAQGEPTLPWARLTGRAGGRRSGPADFSGGGDALAAPVLPRDPNAENGSATGFLFAPSDVNGDAGAGKYVQVVNGTFAVYDSGGSRLYGPAGINTVWSGFGGICQTHLDGDPVVVFDEQAGRWLISEFALQDPSNYHECIAISKTADPTGAWYRYDFNYPKANVFGDYPKFGVWPDGYYMSANQFTSNLRGRAAARSSTSGTRCSSASPRDRSTSTFRAGGSRRCFHPTSTGRPVHPSERRTCSRRSTTPVGATAPTSSSSGDSTPTGTTPSQSSFTRVAALPTAPFNSNICGSPPCIVQPGTSQRLDDMSDRLMYRLQYRNFGDRQTLVVSHTVSAGGGRAGVRWYELSDAGSGWQIADQGTVAPSDGNSRWMGSAADGRERRHRGRVFGRGLGDVSVGAIRPAGSPPIPPARSARRGDGLRRVGLPDGDRTMGRLLEHVGRPARRMHVLVHADGLFLDERDRLAYTDIHVPVPGMQRWIGRAGGRRPSPARPSATRSRRAPRSPSCGTPERPISPMTSATAGRRRRVTSPRRVAWKTGTTAAGATFTGSPGSTYCLSARATDASFNTGPWGDEVCTAIPLNETALATSGKWAEKKANGTYLGDYILSSKKGATLTKTNVQARSIALIATTCPTCGTVSVVWKGRVLAKIALTSAVTIKDVLISVAGFNTAQTGDLKIVVASAGKPVKIEGRGAQPRLIASRRNGRHASRQPREFQEVTCGRFVARLVPVIVIAVSVSFSAPAPAGARQSAGAPRVRFAGVSDEGVAGRRRRIEPAREPPDGSTVGRHRCKTRAMDAARPPPRSAAPSTQAPVLGSGFEAEPDGSPLVSPSDAAGAVGTTAVMAAANVHVGVFNRTGTQLVPPQRLGSVAPVVLQRHRSEGGLRPLERRVVRPVVHRVHEHAGEDRRDDRSRGAGRRHGQLVLDHLQWRPGDGRRSSVLRLRHARLQR